jgi:hypothetical protein
MQRELGIRHEIEHYTPFPCRFAEELSHEAIGNRRYTIGKENDHGRTRIIPPFRYDCIGSLESLVETVPPLWGIGEEELEKLAWRPRRVVFAHEFHALSV